MNLSMISFWDKSDASTIIITFREIVTVLLNNLPPLPLLLHLISFHLQGLINPARSRIQVLWRHQYLVHERARSNCMVWCLRPDNPTSALLQYIHNWNWNGILQNHNNTNLDKDLYCITFSDSFCLALSLRTDLLRSMAWARKNILRIVTAYRPRLYKWLFC